MAESFKRASYAGALRIFIVGMQDLSKTLKLGEIGKATNIPCMHDHKPDQLYQLVIVNLLISTSGICSCNGPIMQTRHGAIGKSP